MCDVQPMAAPTSDELVDALAKHDMVMARVTKRGGMQVSFVVYGELAQCLLETYPLGQFKTEISTHASPIAKHISAAVAKEAGEQREREDMAHDFMAALTQADTRAKNGTTGNAGMTRKGD